MKPPEIWIYSRMPMSYLAEREEKYHYLTDFKEALHKTFHWQRHYDLTADSTRG